MSELRCENCRYWELVNAAPLALQHAAWRYEEGEPVPHANLKWAKCHAALEGWEDDFDVTAHRMAVFDGSAYHAQLLTRFDFLCCEYDEREPKP